MNVSIWVCLLESLHSVRSLWQLAAVILAIWSVSLCKYGYNTDPSLICMTVKISWHKPEEEIQRFQEARWFIKSIYMHLADQAFIIFFEKIQNLPPLTKLRRRHWHPTPVLSPRKSYGRWSLVGCGLWGLTESDMTEATSLSLFTFMHWRRKWQSTPVFLPGASAWWAAVYGVPQSWTRLKQLSSSSSSKKSWRTVDEGCAKIIKKHSSDHPL